MEILCKPLGAHRRASLSVLGFVVAGVLVLHSGAPTVTPTAVATTTATGESWLTGDYSVSQIASVNRTVADHFFNTTNSWVIGKPVSGFAAPGVADYKSYATFAHAVAAGTAPKSGWVLYDNEKWSFTPVSEEQQPAKYMKAFADLAHQHHLMVIETPARDLVAVSGAACGMGGGLSMDAAFIKCQIPADGRYADVLDIQAQADESNVTAYSNFLNAARTQVIAVAPNIRIIAGLTTDRGESASQIFAAWQSVHTRVAGFWMNTGSSTVSVAAAAMSKILAAGG